MNPKKVQKIDDPSEGGRKGKKETLNKFEKFDSPDPRKFTPRNIEESVGKKDQKLRLTKLAQSRFPLSVKYLSRKFAALPHDALEQIHYDEGFVGDTVFQAELNEYAKIHIQLDDPFYAFLMALNPTKDPEFRIQLLWPTSQETAPDALKEFRYPAESNTYYQMSDGVGQQGFLLVTSPDPLPSFDVWKNQNLKTFPWDSFQSPGVWKFDNRSGLHEMLTKSVSRGKTSSINLEPIEKSLKFTRKIEGIEAYFLSFPVLKNSSSDSGEKLSDDEKVEIKRLLNQFVQGSKTEGLLETQLGDALTSLATGELPSNWKNIRQRAKDNSEKLQNTIALLSQLQSELVNKDYETYKAWIANLKEARQHFSTIATMELKTNQDNSIKNRVKNRAGKNGIKSRIKNGPLALIGQLASIQKRLKALSKEQAELQPKILEMLK